MDEPEILSGVFRKVTLGTPIAILIRNTSANSADYDALSDVYRPGHADWTYDAKYGRRDYRGGGRASGRETVGRVAAGAVARVFLASLGVAVRAWCGEIAGVRAPDWGAEGFDAMEAEKNSLRIPNADVAKEAMAKIDEARKAKDSVGGVVCCHVTNPLIGLGEPVFDKLDAALAGAMLSIGAAKGVEFGAGFDAARLTGSVNNDPIVFQPASRSQASFASNNAGGVLGGISTGMPLEFRVAFKPTPSIGVEQRTVSDRGVERVISIAGRHDVCVCPRAAPVVEAMTALVLADFILRDRADHL
jgi:chorismate synthase